MRPLYIDGAPGCRVVLDVPALRVVVPERADMLFPLTRLTKVVCNGVVDWTLSALLACADAGIPVFFLQKNGEIRARLLGAGGQQFSMAQRLLDLQLTPDGIGKYGDWLRAMEKLAARNTARKLGLPDWREISVKDLKLYIVSQVEAASAFRYAEQVLKTVLSAETMQWLCDCGYDITDEVIINNSISLQNDITDLLVWNCYPALLGRLLNYQQKTILAEMAELVCQREDRLFLLVRSICSKLSQFLHSVY